MTGVVRGGPAYNGSLRATDAPAMRDCCLKANRFHAADGLFL